MIIGLGNPGSGYEKNRHNVGFDFIELLARQLNVLLVKPFFKNYKYASITQESRRLHLVQPLTYMNRTGGILPGLMAKYLLGPSNLLVVCDNMDLPCGKARMKKAGSSAGHNGLKSIMNGIGSADFYRLYIGIERPEGQGNMIDHVLGVFSPEKRRAVDTMIKQCASLLSHEIPMETLLNEINSPKP